MLLKQFAYVLGKRGITPQYVSRKATENAVDYAALTDELIEAHQLIINCTPLGTFPHIDQAPPINYKALGEQHFLFDLVYNPAETRLPSIRKKTRGRTANGSDMLVHQANRSWALWMEQ